MKNCVHEGGPQDVMPYTNNTGAAIVSGQLIKMGHTLGVAAVNIPDGGVGSVAVGGCFRSVPKATGHAWNQGDTLIWDVSAQQFDSLAATPATGDVSGGAIAWIAAASGDTTGVIRLTPGSTLVT